jgi:AraC family transcriptional activator of pobA
MWRRVARLGTPHAHAVRRAVSPATAVIARGRIGALMQMLAAEFSGRSYARAQVLRGLVATLLGLAARQLVAAAESDDRRRDTATTAPKMSSAHSPLLPRFEALVEAHHLEHWSVADYAQALAVTPTHLSRITRQASGQPASRLIDERLMREARRQLVYTNLQVATIAYALGFADPGHFSRVFSRATGLSPRAFRQQRSAG